MQKPNKFHADCFGYDEFGKRYGTPRRSNRNPAGLRSNYYGKVKRRKLDGSLR